MQNARFCIECGNALNATREEAPAPTADADWDDTERRQLTVMFCDLMDSTGLATRVDPEQLREIHRAYRALCAESIQRYEGYIARYMGDGILAYFGYPKAHEDDAVRAIKAGLGIASAMPELTVEDSLVEPLSVRIGIATGPVVVGEIIGEGAAREHDVVGETPNLAARLQTLSPANGVIIGEETRRLIGAAFRLEDLGASSLKGFAVAVPAWRVLSEAAIESRFDATFAHGSTPFVGREHEIALILERWQRALEGRGQVILLTGEPGIGKSRITMTARDRLGDAGLVLVQCQCSPYHQNSVLHPVVEHLQRAAGFTESDSADVRLDKLEQLLLPLDGDAPEYMALIASLLSVPFSKRYPALELDPEARRERTLDALVWGFHALVKRHPLLIVMEDVHWADPTTLALLDALVECVQSWKASLIITFRPAFEAPWTGLAHVVLLSLNRLDRERSEFLISRLTGGKALPSEITERIVEKTDGIPLFVEEFTKTILESGLVIEADDCYVLKGPMQPLAIPTTLQDSLTARLDQLDNAKSTAQIGATIGREFSRSLLAAVSGREETSIDAALARLVRSGLVFRRGTGRQTSFVFKHALVQDSAYNSILKSRRHALHARVAQTLVDRFPESAQLQPELVAQHFAAAELPDRALPHWRTAGLHAMERSACDEAISHFHHGLESLTAMAAIEENAAQIMELDTSIAECLRIVERMDEAFAALQHAQDVGERFQLSRHLSNVHHQRGNLFFPMAKAEECLREHQRAVEYARASASAEAEIAALGGLGDAHYAAGRMRTAYRFFDQCVTMAREHGFLATAAANLSMRGFSRTYLFEIREARQDGLDAVALASDAGHPRALLLGETMVYICDYLLGNYEDANANSERALRTARQLGARRFEPQSLYYQAMSLDHLGRQAEALDLLSQGEALARRYSPRFQLTRILGGIALLDGAGDRRERALAEAEHLLDTGDLSHNHFTFCLDAVDTCFDHGEWDRMECYADRMAAYTSEEPLPWGEFAISRARALAAWGRAERSAALIEELRRLQETGRTAGVISALSRIEKALGTANP